MKTSLQSGTQLLNNMENQEELEDLVWETFEDMGIEPLEDQEPLDFSGATPGEDR